MVETLNFYNLTRQDLETFIAGKGKERFRALQLFQWVYRQGVTDFDKMTNLSLSFREEVRGLFHFELPKVVTDIQSQDKTHKLLVDMGGGKTVECVIIPGSNDRLTLCVSSEVGCNMACDFCYTGKRKLQKRLEPYEIVGQFLRAAAVLPPPLKLTNIVFMGMGEPLDNLENVLKAIDIICDPQGINFSRKKITVSTSGLVPLIPELAKAKVRLAVSLNASSDQQRDILMPVNKRWPIRELMAACRQFSKETRDRVTFEYVLLKDVNDSLEDAKRIHEILRTVPNKINLIPFNEHEGTVYKRPDMDRVYAFQDYLLERNYSVFIRKTMGRDIYAACGQLTSKFEGHPHWAKLGAANV